VRPRFESSRVAWARCVPSPYMDGAGRPGQADTNEFQRACKGKRVLIETTARLGTDWHPPRTRDPPQRIGTILLCVPSTGP